MVNPSRVEYIRRETRGRKDPGLLKENRSAVQGHERQPVAQALNEHPALRIATHFPAALFRHRPLITL